MATRLAIASDPAVLRTAPTPVDLVHGPRKRSGPADIPCILGRGSHASAPAPSATVSLANRGGSALSENLVNGTPTSSVVLTLNGAASPAAMTKPGMAQLVPTQVYHRSGKAPRRCIKLVFFLDLAEPIDVEKVSVEEPAAASATDAPDPEVKDEKQTEFTTD